MRIGERSNWAFRHRIYWAIFAGRDYCFVPQTVASDFSNKQHKLLMYKGLRINFKSLSSRGLVLPEVSDGESAAVRLTPAMEIC